jgi:hypothetical protein
MNMKYTSVDSSMIDLVGYDADTEILEVRFVNTGYTYIYEDVPKHEYRDLMKASSKGSAMREIMEVYGGYRLKGKRPEYPKKSPMDKYVGVFAIHSMPDFEDDYLAMDGVPHFKIDKDGTGTFAFGVVTGYFKGKIVEKKDDEVFRFTWKGIDEDEEVNGTGYFLLEDNRTDMEGEISFIDGDDYYFYARKEG